MRATTKDLWVFIETNPGGTPKSVGLELLNPGKRLAKEQGGRLVGVVIASDASVAAKAACNFGADAVITIEGPEFSRYSTDAYVNAFTYLIKKYEPLTVMIGATGNGRDLAPRISSRVETGLVADCVNLSIDKQTGLVAWTRPAFGGNLMAVILCTTHKPQMGTVRPGVFKKPEFVEKNAEIVEERYSIDPDGIRTWVVETLSEADDKVNFDDVDIVVTGGRGVGGPEGFGMIRRFARSIGAVVGSSRAAVEEGWISHAYQIGQTGKTVSPRVYIACGVSGSVQHLVGMNSSKTIIAINKDPKAMIFSIADYGIVGDLFKILPILEEELKNKLKVKELAM